jgi:hypothetical protein
MSFDVQAASDALLSGSVAIGGIALAVLLVMIVKKNWKRLLGVS